MFGHCSNLDVEDVANEGAPTIVTQSRRETALALAEELLADIELSRISSADIAKKASRLARLLDDVDAVEWLSHEISGFSGEGSLNAAAVSAARRSGRQAPSEDGKTLWWTSSLDRLEALVESSRLQLQAAADADVSISSSNPHQRVVAPPGNVRERVHLRDTIVKNRELIGRVVGAIHSYVSAREVELRFGAAIESAFTALRNEVDARIAILAPSAATKFAAAFENASSENPEHWANAAQACRRLLKAIADELRPPGEPVNKREMTDNKYINRLVNWIEHQPKVGNTHNEIVIADLSDFGRRIDAFDNAGHKGAHAEVTKYEASRFIAGTYLLIGDILRLWADVNQASGVSFADDSADDAIEVAAQQSPEFEDESPLIAEVSQSDDN